MDILTHRLQQIALEIEAVEGTAESVLAADADLVVYDVNFEANIEKVQRSPARRYMTRLDSIVGKQFAKVSFGVEVKGVPALGTAPSYGKALKCCGLQQAAIVTIAIGAITGGPFRPGDVVTGGTSAATGLVIDRYVDGVAALHLVVLTGTFASGEVLTGSLSGATATTSAVVTASKGWNYRPDSSKGSSCTISFFHDGKKKTMYGCRGNVKVTATNAGLVKFAFEFQGIYSADADVAMLDPTYESTVPVTFLEATLYLDAVQPEFTGLELDMGCVLNYVETAQSAKGAKFVRITDRAPVVTLDTYATLVADFDFYGKLASATTSYLRAQVGGTSPNKVVLAFPRLSHEGVKETDKSGFQGYSVALGCVAPSVSSGDNEILLSIV